MIYQSLPVHSLFHPPLTEGWFIDIETTGLCKHTHSVLMVGILEKKEEKFFYHFWLLEDLCEETTLLKEVVSFLRDCPKLYTYGGSTFDLSFLEARCSLLQVPLHSHLFFEHVDLKKLPLMRYLLKEMSLNRQTLEHLIHFNRSITTKGKDLVRIILLYVQTKEMTYQTLIKSHNLDELLSLVALCHFYSFLNALTAETCTGFLCERNIVHCTCVPSLTFPVDLQVTLADFTLDYVSSSHTLSLTLPVRQQTLKQFLPYKDYYAVNGQLIHKSLAQCIPATFKRKATKENAFLIKDDMFIFSTTSDALWQDETGKPHCLYDPTTYTKDTFFATLGKIITRGRF
ncbi:MAG: ribonuclease H-like domain-containing protein [Cellulosilyticaceae bacterium]